MKQSLYIAVQFQPADINYFIPEQFQSLELFHSTLIYSANGMNSLDDIKKIVDSIAKKESSFTVTVDSVFSMNADNMHYYALGINSNDIFTLRNRLIELLLIKGLSYNQTFGYHPHITIRKIPLDQPIYPLKTFTLLVDNLTIYSDDQILHRVKLC